MKLKYRNKILHNKYYSQCKVVFDKCIQKIADVHHEHNSNICEGIIKLITKFCPKNRQFNGTLEYKTHFDIAVCIDSIGYSETYIIIFKELGINMTYNLIRTFFTLDKRKKYKRDYYQKIEVKRKRIQKLQDKLREGEQMMRNHRTKEETYKSSMNYNDDEEITQEKMQILLKQKKTKKNKKKQKKQKIMIHHVAVVVFLSTYVKPV